jgi:addiction module RelE/StbE family toxin
MEKLKVITLLLANGKSLPPQNRNYPLTGSWCDHMEYHIEPDWLLVHRLFPREGILEYVRMGMHTDLFE